MKAVTTGKVKQDRFSHVSNSKYGMGDNYGTGIKAKIGRMREGVGMEIATPKKLKTPPRNLA